MDLVHDRGSMDPVHESGPWTRSKEGVHGPLVHVLSSPSTGNVFDKPLWELELLSHARQPEVSFLPFLYALMLPNCIAKFLYS